MQAGDVVYVKCLMAAKYGLYGYAPKATAVILRSFGFKKENHGRAWHVLMEDGTVKTKLTSQLEVIRD